MSGFHEAAPQVQPRESVAEVTIQHSTFTDAQNAVEQNLLSHLQLTPLSSGDMHWTQKKEQSQVLILTLSGLFWFTSQFSI